MKNKDKVVPIILLAVIFFIEVVIKNKIPIVFKLMLEIIIPICVIPVLVYLIILVINDVSMSIKFVNKIRRLAIGAVIFISLVFTYMILSSNDTTNTILDIPNAYNNKYERITGQAFDVFNYSSGTKRIHYHTDFSVDNSRFSVDKEDFTPITEDSIYEITYLPNSKIVIDIKLIPTDK